VIDTTYARPLPDAVLPWPEHCQQGGMDPTPCGNRIHRTERPGLPGGGGRTSCPWSPGRGRWGPLRPRLARMRRFGTRSRHQFESIPRSADGTRTRRRHHRWVPRFSAVSS